MEAFWQDRYLVVRAASLYIAVVATGAVWMWRRPDRRHVTGGALAFFWNLPALLAVQLAAAHFGWWQFDAQGGLLLGIPVELYLAWAWLWGFVFAVAFPALPLVLVAAMVLIADLVLMPAATPVVRLGSNWLLGEGVALLVALIPGLVLARCTSRGTWLEGRAVLQMLAFCGFLLLVLPAIAIDGSGSAWLNPATRPLWQLSLIAQVLAAPALFGLTAVQEFVVRGRGTPVPFDPPRQLVTTGVYAYIRNPMQLSAVVLLILLGLVLESLWVSAAGVVAHIYSAGLAGWDEDEDLRRRFGESWTQYRSAVRGWVPRFRPWFPPENAPARLFVAESCGMCSQVGQWFARRGAKHLDIVPAEVHPSGRLMRITYDPGGGLDELCGIQAVARALEHIHLGWAMLGWVLRLPGICQFAQLLLDASGGEPRDLASRRLDRIGIPNSPPVKEGWLRAERKRSETP